MLKISEPNNSGNNEQQSIAFLDFAFRPFFLFASIFSTVSLIIWVGILSGNVQVSLYGGSLWWHIHEMLFAFAATVIVGFLLTAVQNWSGVRSLHGKALATLIILWLLARVALFMPEQLPDGLIILLDVTFLPLATLALAIPIIKTKLWRNFIFVPILLIMAGTNAVFHYSVITFNPLLTNQAATFMVLLITLVMSVMAGRVFPMFTANGTQTPRVNANPLLEKLSVLSILFSVIAASGVFVLPSVFVATLFIVTAIIHTIRVFRWKLSVTLNTPLVWSLHLSYWCIVLGLLLFGLSKLAIVSPSQAIHTLTIGAMASMILSMISRVSLGHTGRKIVANKMMTFAFVCINIAFVIRVFGTYFIANYLHVLILTVLLWTISFVCFIVVYLPILIKPRLS